MALMLRHARSGGGSASRDGDGEGSERTVRVRVLSAFRTGSFRARAKRWVSREKIAGQRGSGAVPLPPFPAGPNLATFNELQSHGRMSRLMHHLQPGILWHVDHEDILQLTLPTFAVPLVAPCSRTVIGSSLSTVRCARTAALTRLRQPSPSITSGPAGVRRRTIDRTTWCWPAGTATRRRPTLPWWRF